MLKYWSFVATRSKLKERQTLERHEEGALSSPPWSVAPFQLNRFETKPPSAFSSFDELWRDGIGRKSLPPSLPPRARCSRRQQRAFLNAFLVPTLPPSLPILPNQPNQAFCAPRQFVRPSAPRRAVRPSSERSTCHLTALNLHCAGSFFSSPLCC